MLARGGRPDLIARAWRPDEDAIVREKYAELGAIATAALLPGRTVHGVRLRAVRLRVLHVPRWSRSEDLKLADLWESGQRLDKIAAEIGRAPRAVNRRARELGLGMVAPHGYESLTAAVERTGYQTTVQLRRILRWAHVPLYSSRSFAPRKRYRRHFVCPEDVDNAVARWIRSETVSEAARRHGVMRNTILRWLARAGVTKGRKGCAYWRLDPAVVDRAMEQRGAR